MCYGFKLFPPVEDKELFKLLDRNDPRAIDYVNTLFKATPKAKEPSSFETYCRYGKG